MFLQIPIGMNMFQAMVFAVTSSSRSSAFSAQSSDRGHGGEVKVNFNSSDMEDPAIALARSAAIDAFNCGVHAAAALPTYLACT